MGPCHLKYHGGHILFKETKLHSKDLQLTASDILYGEMDFSLAVQRFSVTNLCVLYHCVAV